MLQDPAILAKNVWNIDETRVMLSKLGSLKVLAGKDDPRDYRGARVKRTIVVCVYQLVHLTCGKSLESCIKVLAHETKGRSSPGILYLAYSATHLIACSTTRLLGILGLANPNMLYN